jgi:hypothetical protein
MGERGIDTDDLDQVPIEQVDVGGEPGDTTAGKTPQHRIFQQSGGILGSNFLGAELPTNGEHLDQPFGCQARGRSTKIRCQICV